MRADRLVAIMLLLQQKGQMTAEVLAERLEVSVRTIYRDVEALSIAGIPVYTSSGPQGGIFLDKTWRVALTGLSTPEVRALSVEGVSRPLADLGFGGMDEHAWLKLLAALPSIQQGEAERIRQRIYLDPRGWFEFREEIPYLTILQEAVLHEQEIRIDYKRSTGERANRLVHPHGLVWKANTWYLIARRGENLWRTYRASRILGVFVTGEHFQRDPKFNLKVYWEQSSRVFESQYNEMFPVKLAVHPDLLNYFEWYLPGRYEQKRKLIENGWFELDVLFYSLWDARMTVMGLGEQVEIFSPGELKADVLDFSHRIIQFYS